MVTTNLKLLKASHALQNRVDHLARSLGGVEKYGLETPITVEQVLEHNGRDDAEWVKYTESVHLPTPQNETAETKDLKGVHGIGLPSPAIDEQADVVSLEEAESLEDAFKEILKLPKAKLKVNPVTKKGDVTVAITLSLKAKADAKLHEILNKLALEQNSK